MNGTLPSQKCFSDAQASLMADLDKFINHFVFPIQCVITVVGNCLTMSVLLSGHMKNRANHLLAFLALCDILVFVMMFPHYLAALDVFSKNLEFRLFHFHSKVHFGALSNWFSAAAIWFVLAVSVERLLIIKFPFRSLDIYNTRQLVFISVCILLTTFALTSYHHISHTCLTFVVCNETQVVGRCYSNLEELFGKSRKNPTSDFAKSWINVSVFLNASFAVLIPIFAVAVINISLIRLLKKRNSEDLLIHCVNVNPSSVQEQERKMTHTVLAIVTCFTITQGPSALVFIYQIFYPTTLMIRDISIVANQLVLTGKMLNVILFCLTSSTFRRKLFNTCRCWASLIFYWNRRQSTSSRFSRSQSKSVVTQKTSLVYSPSGRNFNRRISAVSAHSMSLKQLSKTTN